MEKVLDAEWEMQNEELRSGSGARVTLDSEFRISRSGNSQFREAARTFSILNSQFSIP
jgi:hypothetical protein